MPGAFLRDHAVAVGRLLYLAGCSEEVVAAGLLHDTVEDTVVGVEDIERRFGPQVARLVAALTEPAEVHPFAARKEALRRQVAAAGYEAEAIFAADKVVNAQTLRRAIADQGEAQVRERLANPLDEKVEHYRSTLGLLDDVAESLPLVPLLREELDKLADEHTWQARLVAINRLLEGFNRRLVTKVLELCDPEVEWTPALTGRVVFPLEEPERTQVFSEVIELLRDKRQLADSGASILITEVANPRGYARVVREGDRLIGFTRGDDGIRRYFADLAARWDSAHIVIYRLTRLGDQVLAVCGVWARPSDRERELSEQVAVVFGFRAGRIATARTHNDEAEARRAAGA